MRKHRSEISVLMSTYYRERPDYLEEAMKSIWTDQIRKPDQIVLVEDGPLTPELDKVVDSWKEQLGDILTIVANKENLGLAEALNTGIEYCKGTYIARMDSDDKSTPNRFLLQEKYLDEHPYVSILGGALEEFNDQGTLSNIRHYPLHMKGVLSTMYKASPLGHPTVMFRNIFFTSGHRYNDHYYICEDVALWFEAIHDGYVIHNLPDVILYFRRNDSMMTRRGKEKAWSEFHAYVDGIKAIYGEYSFKYIYPVMRLIFRLMPTPLIKLVYNSNFRKKIVK